MLAQDFINVFIFIYTLRKRSAFKAWSQKHSRQSKQDLEHSREAIVAPAWTVNVHQELRIKALNVITD